MYAIFVLIQVQSNAVGTYLLIQKIKDFCDFRINSNKFEYLWYILIQKNGRIRSCYDNNFMLVQPNERVNE